MSTLQIDLPDEIVLHLAQFAERHNVSVDQFAAAALSEFVQTLAGEEYFRMRASRGNREKFLAAMAKVPELPPIPPDELAR